MEKMHRTGRSSLKIFFLILLCCILSVNDPHANLAHAEGRPPNPLENANILILNAYESNVPAFEKADRGLSAALQAGGIGTRNQFYEHLDIVRNPGPENRRLLVELLHRRYDRRKIDFIVTIYPEALQFLLSEGQEIFSDAPVLALLLPKGFVPQETNRRIIPHLVIPDLKETLGIAMKLVPRAKGVYVVGGTHPIDTWLENMARQDFKPWEERLEIRYLSHLPLEEILAAVSGAPQESIVLITSFGKDSAGSYYTTVEVCDRVARLSRAPVFGYMDILLGRGIVGGSLLSFEYIGTKAGELVVDILRGARSAENIPDMLTVPQINTFDWQRLRHWNLSESALPRGSIIVNREFSIWDLKYYMVGILAFILAQSILIAALLVHRRRRIAAENSLRQKTEELDRFFNLSPDLLRIAGTDGYSMLLNPSWERILGHTREELMSKQFFDLVHPEDLNKTREIVSTVASQQKVAHFENRYRCKDGTYRWLEWTTAPAGRTIYSAGRDITERKLADEALQERMRQIEELKQRLESENVYLQEEVKFLVEHSEIVGQSGAIKRILAQVQQVAGTDATVLVLGETGTGKELVARAIHRLSDRRDRPLVTVNCASLPPTLIESELFGREKGAYTGALTRMVGRFELAHGSTLFLDEIGEIPYELQSKLLRVLEEGRFERLGSTKSIEVNVRILAATNRDIAREVKDGKFRKDLFYRLNVFPIVIPPLRERTEDIPLLVWAFVKEFENRLGKRIERIQKNSMDALQGYPWPGNVRELRNVIEHAMILSPGGTLSVAVPKLDSLETIVNSSLENMERDHILQVLRKVNWRVSGVGGAAEILGLKRTTLQSLMKKLGIRRPSD